MAGIRLVIQFTTNSAEEADERVKTLAARCEKTVAEPGCVQFEVFRSAVRPNVYALLEHWASQEALEAHWALMGGRPQHAPGTIRERYEHQTLP